MSPRSPCVSEALTGEDSPTKRSHNAHQENGDGHEAGYLVLAQGGEGKKSSGDVEEQRGDHSPEEHAIPHLCKHNKKEPRVLNKQTNKKKESRTKRKDFRESYFLAQRIQYAVS